MWEGRTMVKKIFRRNKEKRWLHCLKCGRPMWTNICHRICRRCTKRNYEVVPTLQYALLQGTDFHVNEYEME
jgi:hypothetical protein